MHHNGAWIKYALGVCMWIVKRVTLIPQRIKQMHMRCSSNAYKWCGCSCIIWLAAKLRKADDGKGRRQPFSYRSSYAWVSIHTIGLAGDYSEQRPTAVRFSRYRTAKRPESTPSSRSCRTWMRRYEFHILMKFFFCTRQPLLSAEAERAQ